MSDMSEFFINDVAELYTAIRSHNQGSRGHLLIPESDTFNKDYANTLGLNPHRVKQYLQSLKEAHHIFIFNITKADTDRNIAPLDGYVVAEQEIMENLLPLYESKLHQEYMNQNNPDKSTDGILKELLPQMNVYNNSPLGKILNVVQMLREYNHFLRDHPEEFTEEFRGDRLRENLEEKGFIVFDQETNKHIAKELFEKKQSEVEVEEGDYYSVDESTPENTYATSYLKDRINLTFEKALKIYGLQFIVRFHFNRNQFSLVENLINQNRYFDLQDLLFIKRQIRAVMKELNNNPSLVMHRSDIYSLDRTLSKTIRRYSIA